MEIYSRIWMTFSCLFFPMRTKDSSRTTARTQAYTRNEAAEDSYFVEKKTTNDSS